MDIWAGLLGTLPIGAAGFALLWPVSILRRDASLVDFWWGPGIAAMAFAALAAAPEPGGHAVLLAGLLGLWGGRLGLQLGLRRLREKAEDPRYTEIRRAWDPGFWWKSLFIVFTLQAVLQALIAAAPLAAILAAEGPPGPLAWAGALLALAGIAVETVADTELDRFRARHGHGALFTGGLRRFVRYPNYLGEIVAWCGISAIALDAGVVWAPVSALVVALLLLKVSGVPVLEERLARTRGGFDRYREAVPPLLPRGLPREAERRDISGRRVPGGQ